MPSSSRHTNVAGDFNLTGIDDGQRIVAARYALHTAVNGQCTCCFDQRVGSERQAAKGHGLANAAIEQSATVGHASSRQYEIVL